MKEILMYDKLALKRTGNFSKIGAGINGYM